MADAARAIEDFKTANRPSGGEPKLEMKGNDNNSSSNQPSSSPSPSSSCSTVPDHAPPQTVDASPVGTVSKEDIDKYKIYNYNKSNVKYGVGDAESKRQRRMVKYNSYAVESKLKSSLMNWFRWTKNK